MNCVPQLSSPPFTQQFDLYDSSPLFLRRSSNTSCLNDDEDDGFLEVLDDHMEVRPAHLDCAVARGPTGSQ